MARLVGVEIPNKRIEIALTYIYGIGRVTASKIVEQAKIDPAKKSADLSKEELNKLRAILDNYKIEGELRSTIQFDVKRLKDTGCYKGLRHRMKLPCRGQRTHSNARSHKGARPSIGGRKSK